MMPLDPHALARFRADAADWTFSRDRGGLISREFVFSDFDQAFGFMTQIALSASRADHHPEWSNVYNRVQVMLTTHDAGGLSARDVDMSRRIDDVYRLCRGALPA